MSQLLWIDDEIRPDDPLVKGLAADGHSVTVAATAAAAIAAATRPWDVLVVDLRLPEGSGVEIVQALRAAGVDSPFIVVTGFATVPTAAACMRLGAVDLLEKPIDLDHLRAAVHKALPGVASTPPCERNRALRDLTTAIEAVGAAPSTSDAEELRRQVLTVLINAFDATVPRYGALPQVAEALALTLKATDVRAAIEQVSTLLSRERTPRVYGLIVERVLAELIYSPRLSEEQLASTARMSPRRLGTLIRSETGTSFRAWRRLLRSSRTIQALLDTAEHVSQLAFDAGYEHPSQLDRDFRHLFGVSPREFRSVMRRGRDMRETQSLL